MKRAGYSLAATAALALALPAIAQEPAGQSPRTGPLIPRYLAAQKVGGCVVRHNPKVAMRLVLSAGDDRKNPASPESEFRYAAAPCLNGEFRSARLNSIEVRGAVAEALLKDHDAALLRQARATVPRKAERVVAANGAPNLALFGCTVAAMPAQAAALLDAAPGSNAEASAFATIGPAMQDCAPADGALHVKPSNVRWLVATSLYRLAAGG